MPWAIYHNIVSYIYLMKQISYKGKNIYIDDENLGLLRDFSWYYIKSRMKKVKYYLMCRIDGKSYYLHRLIMKAKKGQIIGHVNSDTLDFRKENLKLITAQQNRLNAKTYTAKSKYKGVFFKKGRKKPYYAMLQLPGKAYQGGSHTTEIEAAKAYNEMYKKIFNKEAYPIKSPR